MNLSKEKEKPLISFLVTAYNLPADMLRACLESILAVGLPARQRQIILVDDGSDPPAVQHLAPLLSDSSDGSDIIYIRQSNQGLSVARNTALQNATGEYIQFVDGDDLLQPNAYRHCLKIVEERHPDILLFGRERTATASPKSLPPSPSQGRGEQSNSAFASPLPWEGDGGRLYMLHHNLRAAAWGYIFRRAILGELRFTPQLLHEDEEFTPLLFLRADTVLETTCKAYIYRERQQSITTTTTQGNIDKRLADMEHIIRKLHQQADRMPKADRDALNRRVAQLSMAYLYTTAKLTQSASRLNKATQTLKKLGLFPLPAKGYTRKYTMFRQLTRTAAGRRLLILITKHHSEP